MSKIGDISRQLYHCCLSALLDHYVHLIKAISAQRHFLYTDWKISIGLFASMWSTISLVRLNWRLVYSVLQCPSPVQLGVTFFLFGYQTIIISFIRTCIKIHTFQMVLKKRKYMHLKNNLVTTQDLVTEKG